MKLKFWERHGAARKPNTTSGNATIAKPFEPLTRQESLAILLEASLWIRQEATALLSMPEGPAKQRRQAELCARDKSLERDFQALHG